MSTTPSSSLGSDEADVDVVVTRVAGPPELLEESPSPHEAPSTPSETRRSASAIDRAWRARREPTRLLRRAGGGSRRTGRVAGGLCADGLVVEDATWQVIAFS